MPGWKLNYDGCILGGRGQAAFRVDLKLYVKKLTHLRVSLSSWHSARRFERTTSYMRMINSLIFETISARLLLGRWLRAVRRDHQWRGSRHRNQEMVASPQPSFCVVGVGG